MTPRHDPEHHLFVDSVEDIDVTIDVDAGSARQLLVIDCVERVEGVELYREKRVISGVGLPATQTQASQVQGVLYYGIWAAFVKRHVNNRSSVQCMPEVRLF